MPVAKRDGSVCICGDYKITLDQALKSEVYLLPKIKELFVGGIHFTKLDLSHAYGTNNWLVLDENSALVSTPNMKVCRTPDPTAYLKS